MGGIVSTLFNNGDKPEVPGGVNASGNEALAAGQQNEARSSESYAWAKDQGEQQLGLSRDVTGRQLGLAGENTANATESWGNYRKLFSQVSSDATNYDSPERYEQVRQEAAGNANQAFDTAERSREVNLGHFGINPNSARFVDPTAMSLSRTAGVADSMNTATANLRNTAIGLRSNAAGTGLNAANSQAGLALSGNNAALSGSNATLGTVGQIRGLPTQWSSAGLQGFNTAAGAFGTQGQLNIVATNAQTARFNEGRAEAATIGSITGGAMAASDENVKEDKVAIDAELILDGLKRIPVLAWKYKDGVADSGRHVGPMAQDVHREFGERAAPGGVMIDLVTMNGISMAGIQALARKVDRLEARAGLRRAA